ncbi:MAG: hypothetical protein LBH20_01360 [Treponema sp.]|jgi:hypothetical protein|nr:hypothetical protein [Treponema sp.]
MLGKYVNKMKSYLIVLKIIDLLEISEFYAKVRLIPIPDINLGWIKVNSTPNPIIKRSEKGILLPPIQAIFGIMANASPHTPKKPSLTDTAQKSSFFLCSADKSNCQNKMWGMDSCAAALTLT